MRINSKKHLFSHSTPLGRARGVALVLVLCFLVLISAILLAFFASVTTEYGGAKMTNNGAKTQQLADSAVQLVIGTINQATTQGSNIAWASQPGMIRTYGDAGNIASGDPLAYYKLYSSNQMIVQNPSASWDPGQDVDKAWDQETAVYTDLNSPVRDTSGDLIFPIVDPGAATATSTSGAVAGFSFNAGTIDFPTTSNGKQQLPMPVKWLYQLRDGTLISPDPTGSTTATFTSSSVQPTAANPIIGRIAYWTDDETCKININTACGDTAPNPDNTNPPTSGVGSTAAAGSVGIGAFWDTPKCCSFFEHDQLAQFQPAQNEFQRYPGHPATVNLTAVFPQITDRNQLLSIVPRISGVGSGGGTTLAVPPPFDGGVPPVSTITLDTDRLYASIDELVFAPLIAGDNNTRALNSATINKAELERKKFFLTASSRAPELNLFGQPRVATWPVDSLYDFSTTPNLRTTVYDRMIAFCSHLGLLGLGTGQDYFFRRNGQSVVGGYAQSLGSGYGTTQGPSSDGAISSNQALYTYLQGLTSRAIPGFGGGASGFAGKFGVDRNQILTEILDYIRCTDSFDDVIANNPGAGVADTYTPGSLGVAYAYGHVWDPGHGYIAPLQWPPSIDGISMGFGRYQTIAEIGLQFIVNADGSGGTLPPLASKVSNVGSGNYNANFAYADYAAESNQISVLPATGMYTATYANRALQYYGKQLTNNQICIQAILLFKPYCVSRGYTLMGPDYQIEVSGLDGLQINGTSLNFPSGNPSQTTLFTTTLSTATNQSGYPYVAPYVNQEQKAIGGGSSFDQLLYAAWGVQMTFPSFGPLADTSGIQQWPINSTPVWRNSAYPFVSAPTVITATHGGTMNFAATKPLTISIYYGTQSAQQSQQLIQTMTVPINQLNAGNPLPVPGLVTNVTAGRGSQGMSGPEDYWAFHETGIWGPNTGPKGSTISYPGRVDAMGQFNTGWEFSSNNAYTNNNNTTQPINTNQSDVVRTLVAGWPNDGSSIAKGDYRLLAGRRNVPATAWIPYITGSLAYDTSLNLLHHFTSPDGVPPQNPFWERCPPPNGYPSNGTYVSGINPAGMGYNGYVDSALPPPPFGTTAGLMSEATGDFDNGISYLADGPYINKPDEGNANSASNPLPYFDYDNALDMNGYTAKYFDSYPAYFSPNKIICSPGMFGSLSTGVQRGLPWQTLLFRPQPGHPDAVTSSAGTYAQPPDHLIMDLFWMPDVQPYPISSGYSTAGKINMNYQIVPFTYIDRSTALVAALQSEMILAIPPGDSNLYKNKGVRGGWNYGAAQGIPAFKAS